MKVVFTGPAVDNAGHSITRDNLTLACKKAGVTVQTAVRQDTELLVASRKDTVKAKNAGATGLTVLTYPEFIGRYLRTVDIVHGGTPNRYTDKVDLDMLAPDFMAGVFDETAEFI
jgi:hypothetical protein